MTAPSADRIRRAADRARTGLLPPPGRRPWVVLDEAAAAIAPFLDDIASQLEMANGRVSSCDEPAAVMFADELARALLGESGE